MAKPIEKLFGLSWNEYLTHPTSDLAIEWISYSLGILFLVSCVLVWFMEKLKWAKHILLISILVMLPNVWLHFLGYAVNVLQIFEFGLQLTAPILLWLLHIKKLTHTTTNLVLKIALAVTFTAHGLYAMGVFPLPQKFIQMTISGFGVNNQQAINILWVAGLLDILLSIGIFFNTKIQKTALMYAVIWGFSTAFARIYCNVYGFDFWNGLSQWHWQFLIRNAHFLIPFLLLKPLFNKTQSA